LTFQPPKLQPLNDDKKLKQFLSILFLVMAVALIGSFILQQFYADTGVVSGVYLEDVVLTSKLDASGWPIDQVSSFSSTIDRIYCFLNIRGVFGLPMGGVIVVKWYYGPEQIRAHYFDTNSKPAILWIEPRNNEDFRLGHYTIEVFINQKLVRSVEFEIQ
jgi:hypothetical protein